MTADRRCLSTDPGDRAGVVSKLGDYKWQIGAAVFLLAGLMLSGNGLRALVPVAKFIAPFLVIWVIFRLVRHKLKTMASGAVSGRLQEMMRQMAEQQQGGRSGKGVIDLCPKCGSYLKPGHKCSVRKG